MPSSTIVWNGVTLTLPRVIDSWDHKIDGDTARRRSIGGQHKAYHRSYLWRVALLLRNLAMTTEHGLLNWWAWAMMGNYFSLAYDSTKALSTTLDGTAAAAQKVVPLTTTTGLTAGDEVILTTAARTYYELGVIDTIDAGVSVTLVGNLNRAYASGDSFRHLFYLPRCVVVDDTYPIKLDGRGEANTLSLDLVVEEDIA